jgi:hypothetical protein
MNWLKNPMFIMVGMSMVLMFMTKRMPKPDPTEMEEMSASLGGAAG